MRQVSQGNIRADVATESPVDLPKIEAIAHAATPWMVISAEATRDVAYGCDSNKQRDLPCLSLPTCFIRPES